MTFDKLLLIGNLGNDPVTRQIPNGNKVTTFSMACSRAWRNRTEELQSETIWYRINAWGAQGESCQKYLKKGSRVLVEGQLAAEPRVFQRSNGDMASSYEVRALNVKFLDTRTNEPENDDFDADQVPF